MDRKLDSSDDAKQFIQSNWAARGFSCELWTDPPGQCWEDFTHATDEVVIVLEGEMEFEVDGELSHPQLGEELGPLLGCSLGPRLGTRDSLGDIKPSGPGGTLPSGL